MMCLVYEIYKDSKLDYMRIYITSNWYNKRAPIKNSFFKDDNISSIQKMVLRVTSSSRLKMAEMQAVPSIRLIVLFKRLHL